MRIIEDTKYDFSDLLIIPKRSSLISRKNVVLEKEYTFLHSPYTYRGIPIISSNMTHTGTFEMAHVLNKYGLSAAIHKHYEPQELADFFSMSHDAWNFYSMGILEKDYEKFKKVNELMQYGKIDYINLDVANGYSEQFVETVKRMRDEFPDLVIMAGTVVTGEMTEQLLLSGADIIRIGIGSGSVCTTRKKTGVGYPQASAVIECADAAHGLKGHVVSDGGCTMPGDVSKAFGAGADFVMLGGMFAGHDEGGGEKVFENIPPQIGLPNFSSPPTEEQMYSLGISSYFNTTDNKAYEFDDIRNEWFESELPELTPTHMKFHGMSSEAAMKKYAGGVAEYRASEGKEVLVPYRGSVENTIKEILGGVRSTCTYVGAKTLKELPKRTTFIKVNQTHNTVFGDEK
jgi:GMP reductase